MVCPHLLFDLQSFSHPHFFAKGMVVWESLKEFEGSIRSLKLGKKETLIPPLAFLIDPETVSIGKGTTIEPGVTIQGPCIIGEECKIRQGAYIRGPAFIGNRCVIGHGTEIKSSILLNDCKAAHFNYVGDSILGNHVNLGAGAICANYRLDGKEIVVQIEEMVYKTGMRKLGGIIGDGSQIGCQCVINPGVLLKKYTRIRPLSSIQASNLKRKHV